MVSLGSFKYRQIPFNIQLTDNVRCIQEHLQPCSPQVWSQNGGLRCLAASCSIFLDRQRIASAVWKPAWQMMRMEPCPNFLACLSGPAKLPDSSFCHPYLHYTITPSWSTLFWPCSKACMPLSC